MKALKLTEPSKTTRTVNVETTPLYGTSGYVYTHIWSVGFKNDIKCVYLTAKSTKDTDLSGFIGLNAEQSERLGKWLIKAAKELRGGKK